VKTPRAGLLTLVALTAAVAGFLAFRLIGPRTTPASGLVPDAAAPAAAAVPPAAPPATAATIPELVPDVRLPDLGGVARPLRDGSGRPHLYNFWATWCEPCRREIPLLNTLQGAYRADDLQVVGIALDFRDAVQAFLKTTPLHYALRVGEEDGLDVAQKFGVEMALPFSVFADGQDRIVAIKVGELHREDATAILTRMRQLHQARIGLKEAQAAIREDLHALALARAKQSSK
jgi:thiol-disulfide isomerase/thioredoxin